MIDWTQLEITARRATEQDRVWVPNAEVVLKLNHKGGGPLHGIIRPITSTELDQQEHARPHR